MSDKQKRGDVRGADGSADEQPKGFFSIFRGQLPLENETTVFILVNAFDVFMTWVLLNLGNFRESNGVANYFLLKFGMKGMIYFKFAMVAFVCIIAQLIATRKINTARFLLRLGTIIVALVVLYSMYLFIRFSGFV